jgi:glycosyltransferase involved in cell wall biosynthesis
MKSLFRTNKPMSCEDPKSNPSLYDKESLRLEAVTTCVGFDDLLDHAITRNFPHLDTLIVVTTHQDRATQAVARKHGAICVQTDLFGKNGRCFNKGAAINAGLDYFQYHGWRLHLDADIILPDNFRRLLFNHTHLEEDCIYGCDRMDVVLGGRSVRDIPFDLPQHTRGCLLGPQHGTFSHRYVHTLRGYVPIGYFQLWHARAQKPYPYSLGTAQHDDVMFGALWPHSRRRLLPSAVCYHICARPPRIGENWEGKRAQPRIA